MADEVKNTKEQEVKDVQPEKTDVKPEVAAEKTIGEVLQAEPKKESPKPDVVGLDKFLDIKKENKELKKALKELEAKIADGDDIDEIEDDASDIYEQFPDVDKKFIKAVVRQAEKVAESKLEAKFKPLEDAQKETDFTKVFNKYFKDAVEKMPDYADIVNKDVIKSLASQKSNANKTLPQLIEETYGKAIGGKRTVESTVHRGGKEPNKVDVERASKDMAYLREVLSDPELKRQYNDGLAQRVLR